MAGRPPKATAQVAAEVERALALGTTIDQAAAAVHVSPRTLKRWLADGVVTRQRLRSVPDPDHAAQPSEGSFSDDAIEKAMVSAVLRGATVDWRAAAWVLERRFDHWRKP
jgi:hypothetical protein